MNQHSDDTPFHALADYNSSATKARFLIRILEGVAFFLLFPAIALVASNYVPPSVYAAWTALCLTILAVMLPAWLGVLALRRHLNRLHARFYQRLQQIENQPVRIYSKPDDLQRLKPAPSPQRV